MMADAGGVNGIPVGGFVESAQEPLETIDSAKGVHQGVDYGECGFDI